MQFDDQLVRHFGTHDLASLTPDGLASGMERLAVEFGLETDPGRRFAMWCLMHVLGNAPDLEQSFDDAQHRDAARDFMDMLARAEQG